MTAALERVVFLDFLQIFSKKCTNRKPSPPPFWQSAKAGARCNVTFIQSPPQIHFTPHHNNKLDMATASSTKKSVKSANNSFKGSKRGEETPSADQLKDESIMDLEQMSPEHCASEEKPPNNEQDENIQLQVPREPSPEPVYEEPILTQLIVER